MCITALLRVCVYLYMYVAETVRRQQKFECYLYKTRSCRCPHITSGSLSTLYCLHIYIYLSHTIYIILKFQVAVRILPVKRDSLFNIINCPKSPNLTKEWCDILSGYVVYFVTADRRRVSHPPPRRERSSASSSCHIDKYKNNNFRSSFVFFFCWL